MGLTRKQIIVTVIVIVALLLVVKFGNVTGNVVNSGESEMVKVNFETNKGNIVLEMASDMPITAGNFVGLVEKGFYDGVRFHRVIDGFMIQGGDPLSKDVANKGRWGTGGSENIRDEFGAMKNDRGTIAMANAGPNTGSSQFFINLADNNFLDGKHPVFGKVVEGMDVVDAIAKSKTAPGDVPVEDVIILKASVL
jgi:peptidylprolyl isomerase